MIRLLAAALAGSICIGAEACEPGLRGDDVHRTESDRYVLAYRAHPVRIEVGRHFALDVAVCARNQAAKPDTLRVDAHMPAHRHGMNYVPTVTMVRSGRWRAEGLLFHMPGEWEFRFDVRAAGETDRLTDSYRIE